MGVPTSEVGYTSARPRREDHEVRKGDVGALDIQKENKKRFENIRKIIIYNITLHLQYIIHHTRRHHP